MAKYKHLTLDERYAIQHMLDDKQSFAAIARKLGRDRTTKRRYVLDIPPSRFFSFNKNQQEIPNPQR